MALIKSKSLTVVGTCRIAALPATVSEVEYERRLDDERKPVVATFDVQFSDKIGVPQLVEAIESVSGVRRVHVQQPH